MHGEASQESRSVQHRVSEFGSSGVPAGARGQVSSLPASVLLYQSHPLKAIQWALSLTSLLAVKKKPGMILQSV